MNPVKTNKHKLESALSEFKAGKRVIEICNQCGIDEDNIVQIDDKLDSPKASLKELEERYIELKNLLIAQTQVIGLPSLHGTHFIHIKEIIYCKGESSQTSLFLADRKRYMVNRTLKECESVLTKLGFCRIHKSNLINLIHIKAYTRGEGRFIEMDEGTQLEITSAYRQNLLKSLLQL